MSRADRMSSPTSTLSPATTPSRRHRPQLTVVIPTPTMLERVLSLRRGTPQNDDDDDGAADESKTKRHRYLFSPAIKRASNYLSRISCPGVYWLCTIALFLFLLSAFSLLFSYRGFVCVSTYNPVSRLGLSGPDAIESDFGALGVPWCKRLCASDLIH